MKVQNKGTKMKFILNRVDDRSNHSIGWIVGYGLLFWLITRIIAVVLLFICSNIYSRYGINPEELTKFAGMPDSLYNSFYIIITAALMAPLIEECIFRLGLSFKRWHIALGASAIPAYIAWQGLMYREWWITSSWLVGAAILFSAIYFMTNDRLWSKLKNKFLQSAIWISALAFGLAHLIAFSDYSLLLIPYMLCVILVPLFGGFAITYYRINLGFWWGVGLHIFNNMPAVIMLCM